MARIGVARSDSMVPRSFSRTTARAVAMTEDTMRMKASKPGTRKMDDLRSGLYQTRGLPLDRRAWTSMP